MIDKGARDDIRDEIPRTPTIRLGSWQGQGESPGSAGIGPPKAEGPRTTGPGRRLQMYTGQRADQENKEGAHARRLR